MEFLTHFLAFTLGGTVGIMAVALLIGGNGGIRKE